ncbi:MAG: hypothetical protein ACI9WU_003718, partial [Myxococcota bacterium]
MGTRGTGQGIGLVLGLLACLAVGCVGGDTGINPPPPRDYVVQPEVAAVGENPPIGKPAAAPAPSGLSRKAPAPNQRDAPSVFDPVQPTSPSTRYERPVAKADREPGRFARIGIQRAVTTRLLDELPNATVRSAHLDDADVPVIKPGTRSFVNPYAPAGNRRLNQRLVWSDGKRFQWRQRSALALPVPATLTYELEVPPASALTFDLAIGARVGSGKVRVAVEIQDAEPGNDSAAPTEAWTHSQASAPLHRLKRWTSQSVDLRAWAGRKVKLSIKTQTDEQSTSRLVAFLAQPVVMTEVHEDITREVARSATGLDVADNVLLIVVDAQRADSIGQVRESAGLPRLFEWMETLVADGLELTGAYSAGNQTRLSTFAFLQSQLPTAGRFHKVRWNYSKQERADYYAADPPLLARLLGGLGYRTVAVANNLFLFGNLKLSLDAGFDDTMDHRHNTKDTDLITESATDWLRANHQDRFFMTVNYNA